MEKLANLKRSVKKLAYAIRNADNDVPTDAQVETMIDAGCDVLAGIVTLVKSIWREE